MNTYNYKSKRFLFPILSLVIISIISVVSISSYLTINMFKTHMEEHIEETKKNYTEKHKYEVYKNVNFVNDSINFQITKIENNLKNSLKEKIIVASNVAKFIYNSQKDTLSKEEIKNRIAKALKLIKFNNNRSYYFMYDNKTKIIFGHPMKKFIGKDMTNFKDSKGQSLMELDTKVLKNNAIGYNKIYFTKPNNQTKEFPKITCVTRFEPLDLVIGIGEYLDVVENQIKKYVLNRFSKIKYSKKDKYLVILDVHNIDGGKDFGTVLLNSNKPELQGKKISDNHTDSRGNNYRKNFLKLIKEKGEGYTEYWYKKPSTKLPALKLSYIYYQKEWKWIILSGFYYENLENQIAIMKESINNYTNNIISKTIVWVTLLSLLAILIATFVSFKIDQTINKYTDTIIRYKDNKRKQEHLLIQQSKMAAMGEMLGNIAHQWRQPLSTITTAASGAKVQKELDCFTDSQFNSTFDAIDSSARYLSQTIDDFRSFFNPNNNKIVEFYIEDTFTKTLNILSAQFNAKNIKIIQNTENVKLSSIENELIQVLINILNNARDVLVKLDSREKLIFINAKIKDEELIIDIKDNAKGIPKNIITKVFEPYFTTKEKSHGTGIGLYMSKEIVDSHLKGSLTVRNSRYSYKNIEYVGASFTIKIPCNLN